MRDEPEFDLMMTRIEMVIDAARNGFEAILEVSNEGEQLS
jgi:hypothetical protein